MSDFHRGEPRSSLDRVIAALDAAGVRYTLRGDHVQAACPSHPDHKPSLSIDYIAAHARVLLNCQAGCEAGDVLGSIGLTWPELYDDWEPADAYAARRSAERAQGIARPRPRKPTQSTKAQQPKGRLPARLAAPVVRPLGPEQVTETYDYVDLDGTVVMQEQRKQQQVEITGHDGSVQSKTVKTFLPRWAGERGWLSKAPAGFEPPLYDLPDVVRWVAEGRVIWLTEGVKDARRFTEIGEVATTNPSGATNFRASMAETLRGAHVVVVIDHDAAGYGRGLAIHKLLADRAATLRFALPRTWGRHQDASDHFDAGHGLNFAEASVDDLRELELVAKAEDLTIKTTEALAEVQAQVIRADEADNEKSAEAARRAAHRWASEAGKWLVRATELRGDRQLVDDERADRFDDAVDECRSNAKTAYELAGAAPEDHVLAVLRVPEEDVPPPSEPDHFDDVPSAAELADEGRTTVVDHPAAEQVPPPGNRIPMARGAWAYELGGPGRGPRGVYAYADSRWVRVADLPYVHAQIVERDGSGRRTGTQWLASATEDGPTQIITWDDLNTSAWANRLNLRLSREQKAREAAATAFEEIARGAEERERTPRIVDGAVSIPVADTLPAGYLVAADIDRREAIATWNDILMLVAKSPRMSLVLGAAAVAPFVAALGRQSHIVALYGDSDRGKSVTMATAGAIWGDSRSSSGAGLVRPWNATGVGVPRYLGMLGVLPPFLDEAGQASMNSPREWGKLIYDICEGAQRMTAEMRGLGVRISMPWHGILISAGNGRLTDGLGAGKYAGVAKRVIDLETPLTLDAEHADAITALLPTAFGHLGHEILAHVDADRVQSLISDAEAVLGLPEGGNQRTVAKHLHAHLAGAMLLDQITGTGGHLYYAALEAAVDYLDAWTDPLHDADRMLDLVCDAMNREPAMWPEVEDYLAHLRPKPAFGTEDYDREQLPQHGINRSLSGVVKPNADGSTTVWVFSAFWRAACDEQGIDSAVACRELAARDVLQQQESGRRRGEWMKAVSLGRGRTTRKVIKVYELVLRPEDWAGDTDREETRPTPDIPDLPAPEPVEESLFDVPEDGGGPDRDESAGVTGDSEGCYGCVPGGVTSTDVALTCGVTGVTGVTEESSRMPAREGARPRTREEDATPTGEQMLCAVCGTPADQRINGVPIHLGICASQLDELTAGSAQEPPSPPTAGSTPAATSTRTPRFAAPAAVIDAAGVHLPAGAVRPLPPIRHLGDLAMLTSPDQLRLGWGGGEDRLPDVGQVWLMTDALEQFGLPAAMPLPDRALTKDQRAKYSAKMFAKLDDHPMVAGARADGWEFGQGGHLGVWTRLWHPELLRGGAFIVSKPWHHIQDVPLFAGDPGAGQLVDRLALFAQQVGVAYRLTTAATGLDLIDHHRPPRRSAEDTRGEGRGRVALVLRTAAELPQWRASTNDRRFTNLEADFSWWRDWDTLGAEQDRRYVHGWDRNASYLAPWTSIDLGIEGIVHRTGAEAAWDGRERPGYYLVDEWTWDHWGIPDPGSAAGARVGKGRMWVTVHTLRQLAAHGIEPVVHESWTWSTTARYLEGPGKALSTARKTLMASTGDDAAAVLAAVKLLYSSTVGKLAERDHRADFHLWRPDWRDHVIGATKTAILRTIAQAGERTGTYPVAVDRDAIFYLSDEADPVKAWPGNPDKLGTAIGSWKPIGSTTLDNWGPEFLAKRHGGRWPYFEAVTALRGDPS